MGQLPRYSATGSASSVADITASFRSCRSDCWRSLTSAKATSLRRFRSWNSSKSTMPTSLNLRSSCSQRSRMPSVTKQMRVPRLVWSSNRIWYPTSAPSQTPAKKNQKDNEYPDCDVITMPNCAKDERNRETHRRYQGDFAFAFNESHHAAGDQ